MEKRTLQRVEVAYLAECRLADPRALPVLFFQCKLRLPLSFGYMFQIRVRHGWGLTVECQRRCGTPSTPSTSAHTFIFG